MNGIIVARLKCGCAASAWFDYQDDEAERFGKAVAEWMEKGYTVSLENRTSIGAEKCPKHIQPAPTGGTKEVINHE